MVIKRNGFASPYRSTTFQVLADSIISRNGIIQSDGLPYIDGAQIKIPPFTFIQQGLIVEVPYEKVMNIPDTLVPPYFVTVTCPTPSNVDDTQWSFARSPQDVLPETVIIAEYDGTDFKAHERVSVDQLIEWNHQDKLDFNYTGILKGLYTENTGSALRNVSGIIHDRVGQKFDLPSSVVFNLPVNDIDSWERTDRIVYRRPRDFEYRPGQRKYIVGGAYDPTSVNTAHLTTVKTAVTAQTHKNLITLITADNSALVLYAEGYGESWTIKLDKYNNDRITHPTVSETLVSGVSSSDFGATLDGDGYIHIGYYDSSLNIKWAKFYQTGIQSGTTKIVRNIASYPHIPSGLKVVCHPDMDRIYFVLKDLESIGKSQMYLFTTDVNGNTATSNKKLTFSSYNTNEFDVFISDDYLLYLTWTETPLNKTFYAVFDDIGVQKVAPVEVSGSTDGSLDGYGTVIGGSSSPSILVTDNRSIFVLFLQTVGLVKKLAIWNDGIAKLSNYVVATSVIKYDAAFSNQLNKLHITAHVGAGLDIYNIAIQNFVGVWEVHVGSNGSTAEPAGISCNFDKMGSIFNAWIDPIVGTFTDIGGLQVVGHIGSAIVVGSSSTISIDSFEMMLPVSGLTYTPNIGERFVITGSASGSLPDYNNGTYYVEDITLVSLNASNDYYVVKVTPAGNAPFETESPCVIVRAQFATPDGNAIKCVKSVGEKDRVESLTLEVLESDNLLTRVFMPGVVILNAPPVLEEGSPGINTALVTAYGSSVRIDWGKTNANKLYIQSGLHLLDLHTDTDYTVTGGSYALSEGDALYVTLAGTGGPVIPQIVPVALLPWYNPIFILGVVKLGEFVPVHLSGGGMGILDAGEEIILGEDLPLSWRQKLGVLTETTFEAFANEFNISNTDTLPTAISKLDAALHAIQIDKAKEEIFDVTVAQNTFTTSSISWSLDPGAPDITVRVNGVLLTQSPDGVEIRGYKKINTNTIETFSMVQANAEVVIRTERTGGGGGGGSTDLENIFVNIAPSSNGSKSVGTSLKGFKELYLKDTTSSQVYKISLTAGILDIDPV